MSHFITLSKVHVINLEYVSTVKFSEMAAEPSAKVFFSDGRMLEVWGEEYEIVRKVWPVDALIEQARQRRREQDKVDN